MALFALGLTKSALDGTLSRVKSAIDDEAKVRVQVPNDLVFITGEFQMMQSFLNVASMSKERADNQVVRTWLRQLRDLAFDVEDCVEFVAHVHLHSDKSLCPWTNWFLRVMPSCIVGVLPMDEVAAQMQQLKARVMDVSARNTRYNLISNGDSNKPAGIVSSDPAPAPAVAATASTPFHILSEVWEAAGKRRGIGDLKRLIISEGSDLQVISLWQGSSSAGGDDLGIASIIRKAYCDPDVCQEFNSRAWVKLTHPFNLDKFLDSLLTQFFYPPPTPGSSSHQHQYSNILGAQFRQEMRAAVASEDDLLKAELMQQVSDEHKYLVILEQVSTVVEWDAIRMYLPDSNNGSRIVVSTHQLGIALLCTGGPYQVWELGRFSDDHPLCALSKKAPAYGGGEKRGSTSGSKRNETARDWTNEFELFGLLNEGNDLGRCLLEPGVTAVWGIAGVGKSYIVRSFYYGLMLGLGNEYWSSNRMGSCYRIIHATKYSWVDVSRPFNLIDLSRRLLMDFYSDDLETKESAAIDMMEGQDEDTIQGCCKFLRENNCFVVIDGLASTHDWDLIKAAFLCDPQPIESRIVVITNEASVAAYCADRANKVLNVKGLGADAALPFFIKKYWDSGRELTDAEMELSKLVAPKCGGLPKIISAMGAHRTETFLERMRDDFMGILDTDPEFRTLKGLFCWMQSYFDGCSDSVKPCVFYFSVFPADHNIRRGRLLRRWIAEGYSRDKIGSTAEEDGENLFSELVKLSIIQQQSPSISKVNGFFHEYIISRPMEDNLVFALEGRCSPNLEHTGQHLTIRKTWDGDEIVFKSMDLSRLRSLTVFGEWKPFFISTDVNGYVNMRLLRVLDLEDTTSGVTDDELEKIGKLLGRLKFLSLRGCKDITHLPDSLGGLRQLQTLDVRNTCIRVLPWDIIIKLVKLQFIRAGNRRHGQPREEGDVVTSRAAQEDAGVGTSSLLPPPTSANDKCASTSKVDGSTSSLPEEGVVRRPASTFTRPWRSRARELLVSNSCSSWLPKKLRKARLPLRLDDDNGGGGVDIFPVAEWIGQLTNLRALGVVNVNGAGGEAVNLLAELKKLTQLRKLEVSGINPKNWRELCSVITGHGHLESLWIRFDKKEKQEECCDNELFCFDDISEPPKTLKSLKVYDYEGTSGSVLITPIWIKQLHNLQKMDLEATISTWSGMSALRAFPPLGMLRSLRIRLIQNSQFPFPGENLRLQVLKIDFSITKFRVFFLKNHPLVAEVLKVHCSSELSSLPIDGIDTLVGLKEVWLTGSYNDDVKQQLKHQLSKLPNIRLVLKPAVQPTPSL